MLRLIAWSREVFDQLEDTYDANSVVSSSKPGRDPVGMSANDRKSTSVNNGSHES